MNHTLKTTLTSTTLALAVLLTGCASGSYVVLLPSPDGSVGQVTVRGAGGEQVLTQAQSGAPLDGSKAPFEVSNDRLARDFGAAMAARPPLPEQFLLYFERGGSELTAESKTLLPRIVERAKTRTAVDMSVIGHTDTQGSADGNEALALKRAGVIAGQLRELGLQNSLLTVESHGERNLLVATPDEVDEPRNRRVEVILR